jgi:hypothetical protein
MAQRKYRVQIQKEVISYLKRENQFSSWELWESTWLISRERSGNRFKKSVFYGAWHNGVSLRIFKFLTRCASQNSNCTMLYLHNNAEMCSVNDAWVKESERTWQNVWSHQYQSCGSGSALESQAESWSHWNNNSEALGAQNRVMDMEAGRGRSQWKRGGSKWSLGGSFVTLMSSRIRIGVRIKVMRIRKPDQNMK